MCVLEGGQCLLLVDGGRGDGGNNGGLGAASQRILQEAGQLGLPVLVWGKGVQDECVCASSPIGYVRCIYKHVRMRVCVCVCVCVRPHL